MFFFESFLRKRSTPGGQGHESDQLKVLLLIDPDTSALSPPQETSPVHLITALTAESLSNGAVIGIHRGAHVALVEVRQHTSYA